METELMLKLDWDKRIVWCFSKHPEQAETVHAVPFEDVLQFKFRVEDA